MFQFANRHFNTGDVSQWVPPQTIYGFNDFITRYLLPALSPDLGVYSAMPTDRYQLATGLKGQKGKREPYILSATEDYMRCTTNLCERFDLAGGARQIYVIIIREEEQLHIKPEPIMSRESSLASDISNCTTLPPPEQPATDARREATLRATPQRQVTPHQDTPQLRDPSSTLRRGGARRSGTRGPRVEASPAISPPRTRSRASRGMRAG
jgi:hypothetical protein